MSAVQAVLLDALGTLVYLEPPAPRLRAALLELTGVDVGEEAAARGFAAEIAHYTANQMRGADRAGLERLRDDCAEVLRAAIDDPRLEPAAVRRAMMDSIHFSAFPDAAPALQELRARGLRLVVVSNWDCSLSDQLATAGLLGLVDGAVSSAVAGAAKPDPAVFRAALDLAGVPAGRALHVGDSYVNDVHGARAAGVRAVLVCREARPPPGVQAVRTLERVPSLI